MYSKCLLVNPFNIEICLLLSPPLSLKQLLSMYYALATKTYLLVRVLFVDNDCFYTLNLLTIWSCLHIIYCIWEEVTTSVRLLLCVTIAVRLLLFVTIAVRLLLFVTTVSKDFLSFYYPRVIESHWFTWVSQSNHIPMHIKSDESNPWLKLQLHATCDIEKSPFNDWFTGHLNHQIEHQ